MKKHIKVYMEYFGYGEQDYIPDELTGERAVDVHHLVPKSQGGEDVIENLIALTRQNHDKAHDEPEFNEKLKKVHENFMSRNKK